MKGQLKIISLDFLAVIRSNWSPCSKRALSEGAPKLILAKIRVKLVLLREKKLAFLSHKVALGNWEYLQNQSACNNFLNLFMQEFGPYMGLAVF